jgi:hypothetical protein
VKVGDKCEKNAICVAFECEKPAVVLDVTLARRRDWMRVEGEGLGEEHKWEGAWEEIAPVCADHRSGAPDGYTIP